MIRLWCVLLMLVALPALAWAGPFAPVPAGHWGYAECSLLARLGLIDAGMDFSAKSKLSRYELSVAVAEPVNALESIEDKADPAAADLRAKLQELSPGDRKKVGAALHRLITEFKDGLAFLGQKWETARARAEQLASGSTPRWLQPATPMRRVSSAPSPLTGSDEVGPGLVTYDLGGSRLALAYNESRPEDASLGRLGLSVPGGGRVPNITLDGSTATGVRDPMVRSLRGSVEYGLSKRLTLDLAIERMVKEGRGMVSLDTTYLKSLGLGYRLSPSTSLRLRYNIIDYTESSITSPHYADRLAEGRVQVNF